jgi:hypothetical protein
VRAAAAAQHILFHHPAEAHDYIAVCGSHNSLRKKHKTPQPRSSTQRHNRNRMGNRPGWRRDSIFTTEEMHFMPQIPQPFGCLIKVPFGTAIQIEAFMDETDPHDHRLPLFSQQCYPREGTRD